MKQITIHTDGACKGNPGRGGYGSVLVFGKHRKELSAGYRKTTNNRMELRAAIAALELLKEPCKVSIHSDSKYLVDAINKNWIRGWVLRGWVKSDKQPVKNKDLWQRLIHAMQAHQISWHWVKGHAGNTENERCDELANIACDSDALLADEGFETEDQQLF